MSDQKHDEHAPNGPQVIDLEAEEIRTESENSASPSQEERKEAQREDWSPPPPPPHAAKRRSGGAAKWITAGLLLGALGGGWLYRDVLSSYLPSNEMKALTDKVGALEMNNSDLASQLAALQQTVQGASESASAAKDASSAAAEQAGKAGQGLTALDSRLQSTDQRLSAAEEAIKSTSTDLDAFRKSISSIAAAGSATGTTPADTAALAALAQRIDALEKDVASLKSTAGTPAASQANVTATLSQALSDLKAKVAAGTAYAAENERIMRMVPAAAGLDVVSSHAEDGVPTAQQLASQLRGLIPALPGPAKPAAEDGSYFDSLVKSLSGFVTIREIGDTDWRQVAEKAAASADAGDLTQAISTIDTAEGDEPVALGQWRDKAAARIQLDAALEQVSEAVLRQITALGGAQ